MKKRRPSASPPSRPAKRAPLPLRSPASTSTSRSPSPKTEAERQARLQRLRARRVAHFDSLFTAFGSLRIGKH